MLKRETKLIQLEKVQFFIVLKAEKLTGKEMKDFSEAFLARIRSISELKTKRSKVSYSMKILNWRKTRRQ